MFVAQGTNLFTSIALLWQYNTLSGTRKTRSFAVLLLQNKICPDLQHGSLRNIHIRGTDLDKKYFSVYEFNKPLWVIHKCPPSEKHYPFGRNGLQFFIVDIQPKSYVALAAEAVRNAVISRVLHSPIAIGRTTFWLSPMAPCFIIIFQTGKEGKV